MKNLNLIKENKFYLFLILLNIIRLKECANLKCKNLIDRSIRQQAYCFTDCYPVNSTLKSSLIESPNYDVFDSSCKLPKVSTSNLDIVFYQPSQFFFNSKPIIYSNQQGPKIHVFILDFHLISGDIYIDFKKLNVSLLGEINSGIKSRFETTLVLNFVTRQFMTFRIFNLPSQKSKYLTDIKILLNGEASLDLTEKKGDLKVQVFHSPTYDYSPHRQEWMIYLNKIFDSNEIGYVEYLSMFCHISHIRLDLNGMLLSMHTENEFNYLEPLESMPDLADSSNYLADYYLGKNCVFKSQRINAYSNAKFFNNEKFFLENSQPFYFINVEHDSEHELDYLRIFIKECNIGKEYNIIFYVNNQKKNRPNPKKIIIDEANCHLNIYSNVDVYDLLDVNLNVTKYGNGIDYDNFVETYDYEDEQSESLTNDDNNRHVDGVRNNKRIQKTMRYDFREEIIRNVLGKTSLKSFNYLKVISNAREVELRFSSENSKADMAANKFYNKLNQQIFLDKQELNFKSADMYRERWRNYTLKFVVAEADLKEYFTEKNLNLAAYLKREYQDHSNDFFDSMSSKLTDNIENDNEYFLITDKNCRALMLDTQSIIHNDGFLLLFNSNLYRNGSNQETNCYYFDKLTNMYYLTFGFSLNYDTYINSNYFTMKQEIDERKSVGFPNNHFDRKKEKSESDYFNSVVLNSIESNYKVSSNSKIVAKKIRKTKKDSTNANVYNYDIESSIRFKSLDYTISWSVETCWLSESLCFNQVEPSFFVNYNEYSDEDFYYDQENYDSNLHEQKRQRNYDFDYDLDQHMKIKRSDYYLPKYKIVNKNIHYINYTIVSFDTKINFNRSNQYYEHELNLKMRLYDVENYDLNYKVISCNLKPYASCNGSSTQLFNINRLKRKHKRNLVEFQPLKCRSSSKVLKFFERNDLHRKIKTVMLSRFNLSKLSVLEDQVKYDSLEDQTEIRTKCPLFFVKNATNNLQPSTRIGSNLRNTTNFSTLTFMEKTKFLFYKNKLTIILISICIIFCTFCFVMIKLVLLKPKNLDQDAQLRTNLHNSLLANGNIKSCNGRMVHLEKDEHELKPLNESNGNSRTVKMDNKKHRKKTGSKNNISHL